MASGSRGTTLESLYIELGLDLSKLQSDILAADKTVTENLGRLNREKNVIKLRMEADIASLDRVKDATKILEIQEKALNQQLTLTTDRMKILEAAYQQVAKNANSTAQAVNKTEQAFLREKIAVGQLQQQLKELANQKVAPAPTNSLLSGYNSIKGDVAGKLNELAAAWNKVQTASQSADGAITTALEVIGKIPAPVAKAAAVLVGLPLVIKGIESSLLDMAKPAIAAGDSFYVMSRGLQLTIPEMAKLSTIAKVTGIDINEVSSSIRRFSAQITKGGEKSSLIVQTMKRYGAELYDVNGKLKNAIDLSEELGKALKAAEAEGNGAAFRDIVGGKFWSGDFVTYLEDFADNVESAKDIVKNGLANPTWAHAIQGEINKLNTQTAQLGGAFSSALMPVAAEIVPEMTKQFGKLTEIIAANKENIKLLGEAMALPVRILNEFIDGMITLSDKIDEVKDKGTTLGKVFESYGEYRDDLAALMKVAPTAAFSALTSPVSHSTDIAIAAYREEIDAYKKSSEEAANAAKIKDEERQARIANTQALNKVTLEQQQKLEAALAQSDENRIKNAQEAEDIIYGIRHTSYEKSLHDLENQKEAEIQAIEELQDAHKALFNEPNEDLELEKISVYEKTAAKQMQLEQEKEQKLAEIRQRISAADKTELENRMIAIEDEKDAWIDAGMEKAEAEELAQKQLTDYIKSQKKELSENIQTLYNTELENRLAQIEKEKQAWIDKCGDEVKATELAEQQKADAQRAAAMSVLKQQAKEYKIYQRDGLEGLKDYKERQLIKSGVAPEYLNMTPQQLQQFQKANQLADKAILPNFMTDRDKEMYRREMLESPKNYEKRAQKYDDENYVIVDGKKTPLSSVTGYDKGLERLLNISNEALGDKGTELPSVVESVAQSFSEMPTSIQGTTESLGEFSATIQEVTEQLSDIPEIEQAEMPEIDSSVIEELNQSFSDLPPAIEMTTESLNELPTAVQGVMEQLSAIEPQTQESNLPSILSEVEQSFSQIPTVIQTASDSLNSLPMTISGLNENLTSQVSQLFSPMSESLNSVTVKFSDVSGRIENVSSALNTFLSALNTKINQLNTTPNVTNTISINEAHAWDYDHIQALAEKVADVIEPTIKNAIGGGDNSY